jgi:hypothetical protein
MWKEVVEGMRCGDGKRKKTKKTKKITKLHRQFLPRNKASMGGESEKVSLSEAYISTNKVR